MDTVYFSYKYPALEVVKFTKLVEVFFIMFKVPSTICFLRLESMNMDTFKMNLFDFIPHFQSCS